MKFYDVNDYVKSFEIGDIICDCRYKHLAIVDIEDFEFPWVPLFIVYASTYRGFGWLETAWGTVAERLNLWRVIDRTITTEDGACCSANHCGVVRAWESHYCGR